MAVFMDVFITFYTKIRDYLPNFFTGLIIILLGLTLAEVIKKFFIGLVRFLHLTKFLKNSRLTKENEVDIWVEVIGELLKWVTVILFLMPAMEVWGLPQMVTIINNLLLYLPNVIVAVVFSLVGYVVANLSYNLVLQSIKTVQKTASVAIASLAKYTILVLTGLIVLNQLGVAQDLIRILFTGIVLMLSLAGGLAFGLGGKEAAKNFLDEISRNLKK
jgi:small-conductance mechanosensitive channel